MKVYLAKIDHSGGKVRFHLVYARSPKEARRKAAYFASIHFPGLIDVIIMETIE